MKKLSILLLTILLVTGCSVTKIDKVEDEDKFALEYSIKANHIFEYSKIHDIFDIFDDGTGIIYFADSDQEKSLLYTKDINDIFKDLKVNKINYYNPSKIKNNNTKYYRELVNYADEFVGEDEDGNDTLEIPSIYFVKDGEIVSYLNSSEYSVDSLVKKKTKKKIKKEIEESLEKYKSA